MIKEVEIKSLVKSALKARENAYCFYSGYAVGAALLTETGKVFNGVNVENSSFGATNCAERSAIFSAVSAGETEFKAIAIAGGMAGENPVDYAYPCGICRQVMTEFCDINFDVIVAISEDDYKVIKLAQLLPTAFGPDSIK